MTNKNFGYETVTQNCPNGHCQATCPAGKSVLGGGQEWLSTNGTCHVASTYPLSFNIWTGGISPTNSFTTSCAANTKAICANVVNPISCPSNSTGIYPNCVCGNTSQSILTNLNAISPTCVSTRVSNTEIKTVCTYTGSDQIITPPTGATSAIVKAWGGGASGQNDPGGAGGFSTGTIQVSPGDQFAVMVGQGGDMSEGYTALPKTYGFGGETHYMNRAGQGGGLSGVFYRGDLITPTSQSRALVIAGGGGGGDAISVGGRQGTPGNQLTAANSDSNGSPGGNSASLQAAGGGGYLGGSQSQGGSGFVINAATGKQILTGNGTIPPNQNDGDYIGGIAVGISEPTDGSSAKAGNGLVVIRWTIGTGDSNIQYNPASNSCVASTVCPSNSTGIYPNCVCGNTSQPVLTNLNAISPTCVSTRVSNTEIKTVCTYTGSDQVIVAPSGARSADVVAFGASGYKSTKDGGTTYGNITVTGGSSYSVVVGRGGTIPTLTFGQCGHIPADAQNLAYGFGGVAGGGLTGIFSGSSTVTTGDRSRALLIAGGSSVGNEGNIYFRQGAYNMTNSNGNYASAAATGMAAGGTAATFSGGGYKGGTNSASCFWRDGNGCCSGYTKGVITGGSGFGGTIIDSIQQSNLDWNGTAGLANPTGNGNNGHIVIRWTIGAGDSNFQYNPASNSCTNSCPAGASGTHPFCVCPSGQTYNNVANSCTAPVPVSEVINVDSRTGCHTGYCSASLPGTCGATSMERANNICVFRGYSGATAYTSRNGPLANQCWLRDATNWHCFTNQNSACNPVFVTITCSR